MIACVCVCVCVCVCACVRACVRVCVRACVRAFPLVLLLLLLVVLLLLFGGGGCFRFVSFVLLCFVSFRFCFVSFIVGFTKSRIYFDFLVRHTFVFPFELYLKELIVYKPQAC